MMVISNADVAAKVRGAAAEHRVNSATLADQVPMSRMAMSRRMSGSTPFSPAELIRVAKLLQVPVSTFFGERAA